MQVAQARVEQHIRGQRREAISHRVAVGLVHGVQPEQPGPEHDVAAAGLDRPEHPRHVVGRVLEVGVEGQHMRSLRKGDAGAHGGALAEVDRMTVNAHAVVGDHRQLERGAVIAAVVDNHHSIGLG